MIPSVAEAVIDTRVPPGLDEAAVRERIAPVLGELPDQVEIEFTETTSGNESPLDTEFAAAIREWLAEADPGGDARPDRHARVLGQPLVPQGVRIVGRLRLPPAARARPVRPPRRSCTAPTSAPPSPTSSSRRDFYAWLARRFLDG